MKLQSPPHNKKPFNTVVIILAQNSTKTLSKPLKKSREKVPLRSLNVTFRLLTFLKFEEKLLHLVDHLTILKHECYQIKILCFFLQEQ